MTEESPEDRLLEQALRTVRVLEQENRKSQAALRKAQARLDELIAEIYEARQSG